MATGDGMKKPRTGERLIIPARTQGRIIEAAIRSERQTPPLIGSNYPAAPDIYSHTIYVKNNSGTDRGAHAVLGIDGVLFDKADNEHEFRYNTTLDGALPLSKSHTGKYVILAEPIESGKIGRAYAAGSICAAKIDVISSEHQWAEIVDSDADQLGSANRGSARILWKESGTGVKWALIQASGMSWPVMAQAHGFTANGTFTSPDYVTQLTMIAVGGGGKGGDYGSDASLVLGDGDGSATFSRGGGGGAGGGYAAVTSCFVPPNTAFTVTIGAGATATGGTGGTTSISGTRYNPWPQDAPSTVAISVSATGGAGGTNAAGVQGGAGGAGATGGSHEAASGDGGGAPHLTGQSKPGHHGQNGGNGSLNAYGRGGYGGAPGIPYRVTSTVYGEGGKGGENATAPTDGKGGYVMFTW